MAPVQEALSRANLPSDTPVIHHHSLFADTFVLGEHAVLKLTEPTIRSPTRLQQIGEIASALASAGLNVPVPRQGQSFFTSADGRIASLWQKCPGQEVYASARARDGFKSPHHLRNAASFMARAHAIAATLPPPLSLELPGLLFPHHRFCSCASDDFIALHLALAAAPRTRELLSAAMTAAAPFREGAVRCSTGLSFSYIQHDFIPRNLLFDAEGNVVALIDLDFLSYDWVAWDLAWTLDYLAYPRTEIAKRTPPRHDVATAFLTTYEENAAFTSNDRTVQALEYLIPLARFDFSASVAEYYARSGSVDLAERELLWLSQYLSFYTMYPFSPLARRAAS